MSVNVRVRDLMLRRAVRRVRQENDCVARVNAAYRALKNEIADVVKAYTPGASIQDTLTAFSVAISRRVGEMSRCVGSDLPALIRLELTELPDVLERTLNRELDRTMQESAVDYSRQATLTEQEGNFFAFNSVPLAQAAQLLSSPLGGAAFEQSFGDLSAGLLRRLRNALVSGLTAGNSVPTVARAVQGLLGNSRYQAERIVRSEYVRVANQSALLVFQQNRRYLAGVVWYSVLDGRTCPVCGVLDGKFWADPRKARIPVVSTHPMCRCVISPVVKPSRELGLTNPGPKTRASFDGQVPATMKYKSWFYTQSDAFQKDVLGPTRFALYKSGRATFDDFVTAHVRGTRSVQDVLNRLTSPVKFDDDVFQTDDERLAGRFGRSETPKQRAARIKTMKLDPEREAAVLRLFGDKPTIGKPLTFTPAKSLKEASAFLKSELGIKGAYPKTFDLRNANHINKALLRSNAATGVAPKRIEFVSKSGNNVPVAGYSVHRDALVINTAAPTWGDPKLAQRLARQKFWSSDDPILHEMGHAAHSRTAPDLFAPKLTARKLDTVVMRQQRVDALARKVGMKVSRYAATDATEFVAETFAGMMSGKRYPSDVMNAYKALGGPMPNVAPRTVKMLGHSFTVNPTLPIRSLEPFTPSNPLRSLRSAESDALNDALTSFAEVGSANRDSLRDVWRGSPRAAALVRQHSQRALASVKPGSSLTVYHATTQQHIDSIRQNGFDSFTSFSLSPTAARDAVRMMGRESEGKIVVFAVQARQRDVAVFGPSLSQFQGVAHQREILFDRQLPSTRARLLKNDVLGDDMLPLKIGPDVIKPSREKAMAETTKRAFEGKQVITKMVVGGPPKIRGDYGEQIVTEYLSRNLGAKVQKLNVKESNFPLDLATLPYKSKLVGKRVVEAVDVKTGEVVNKKSSQQWRVTLGGITDDTQAALTRMTPSARTRFNARKLDNIMRRKEIEYQRLKALYRNQNVDVVKAEYTVIFNADTRTANIYRFDTFHRRLGWTSDEAKAAYVTTVKVDFDPPQGFVKYTPKVMKLGEARGDRRPVTQAEFNALLRAEFARIDADAKAWFIAAKEAMDTLLAAVEAEEARA